MPTSAAESTTTYTDDYDDVEMVMVYIDGDEVDSDDIMTDYYYEDPYDSDSYTVYLMPLAMTAPASCESEFTYHTFTEVSVPTAVASAGLLSPVSEEKSTTTYDRSTYVYVSAYLSSDAISLTEDITDNYIYSYYVAYCTNPAVYFNEYTTTSTDTYTDLFAPEPTATFGGGNGFDSSGDASESTSSRFGIEDCTSLMHCDWVTTGLIAIAAILPAIFFLGFLESYFWFRRLMTGKSTYRFGTFCWMLLFLPVICLTRRTPARDAEHQSSLKEQWKNTSFGTAVRLWFKYGFRHKYPVELLGEHPGYKNDFPVAPKQVDMQQPIGYGPPPPNMAPGQPPMVYYMPSRADQGSAGPSQFAPMQPPNGGAPSYPQYPQQAVYASAPPQQQQQQRSRQSRTWGPARGGPVSTVSSPSPISEVAEPVRSDVPVRPVSPPVASEEPAAQPPPPPAQHNEAGPSGQART